MVSSLLLILFFLFFFSFLIENSDFFFKLFLLCFVLVLIRCLVFKFNGFESLFNVTFYLFTIRLEFKSVFNECCCWCLSFFPHKRCLHVFLVYICYHFNLFFFYHQNDTTQNKKKRKEKKTQLWVLFFQFKKEIKSQCILNHKVKFRP